MMIFSLVATTGLEKCCITSAYLQWLCHSGERILAHGPLVLKFHIWISHEKIGDPYFFFLSELSILVIAL